MTAQILILVLYTAVWTALGVLVGLCIADRITQPRIEYRMFFMESEPDGRDENFQFEIPGRNQGRKDGIDTRSLT